MLETPAVVVKTEARAALVEADFGGGCGSGLCAKGGCGTAVLAQLFSRTPRSPMRADNPIEARPGERVIVGVEEGMLLRATLIAYLLPLILFVGGALVPHGFQAGDGAAALGALLGLILGWGAARVLSRRWNSSGRGQPVILRRA
jgi:sigma-E factor negative regulatory protein RseC